MSTDPDLDHVWSGFGATLGAQLRVQAGRRRWKAGAVVLRGGEVVPSVVLIAKGALRLVGLSPEGHEMLFRRFAEGEWVGVASAVGNLPLPFDAIAAEACETLHVERARFVELVRSDAAAAYALAQMTSRYAMEMARLVISQTSPSLQDRVLAVVRRMASHEPFSVRDGGVVLNVSQGDLALAAGASRQRVNAALRRLSALGHLSLRYRHIVVFEPPAHPSQFPGAEP